MKKLRIHTLRALVAALLAALAMVFVGPLILGCTPRAQTAAEVVALSVDA